MPVAVTGKVKAVPTLAVSDVALVMAIVWPIFSVKAWVVVPVPLTAEMVIG